MKTDDGRAQVDQLVGRLVNGKRCDGNASVFVSARMRCVGNNVVVTEMKMLPSIANELWTWCFRFMNVETIRIGIMLRFILPPKT